jgi:two-component system, OmpR family, response regulator
MAATQKRVLVVDDALDIARLLRSALSAAEPDLAINVFPSAEEAIFASARETVHLLVSDLRLPGISGGELVRRIRATNPDVKVILISGLNQEQIESHMGGVQVNGFIHKPFEVEAFVAMAQRCLSELDQHGEQQVLTISEPELDLEDVLNLSSGEEDLTDLVSLLDVQPDPGTDVDVDAFWDSLVETASNAAPAQTLSYDEALRLGLTPDEHG